MIARLFTTIADRIWAMDSVGRCLTARAATPSEPSLLRVSGEAGIAIAWIVSTSYAIWLTVTL